MSWTEVDSAVTQPAQTDIAYGPIGTATSLQGRVVTQLDNLPSQHPHYSMIGAYFNEAKDEILRTALQQNRAVLDMVPRLSNWRWSDVTVAAQNYLPMPERMLWLDSVSYSKLQTTYASATDTLYPVTVVPAGSSMDFGVLSRSQTGWPSLCRRAGGRIELWPTPSSSPTDYRTSVVVGGFRMDKDLSGNTDVLLMPPFMQMLAVDLAVVIAMEKMGWEEAASRRQSLMVKLSEQIGGGVKERIATPIRTRVAGMHR